MSDFFNAFEMSPVPAPAEDAQPPEPFRGIYGMPMFVTVSAQDLAQSVEFWTDGLGFFVLFSIPGKLAHLRRWAFQDVLLVPAGEEPSSSPLSVPAVSTAPSTSPAPALTVSFACVLNQIETTAEACERLRPGCVQGPRTTLWNSREIEVATPEGVRVILTAARPLDPHSEQAGNMERIGIRVPRAPEES